MRATLLLLCLSLLGCPTSNLGACNQDGDCPTNSVCGSASSAQVCVLAICPSCGTGQVCSHGACIAGGVCTPACDSSHTCDPATLTCVAGVPPSITSITIPSADATVNGRGYYGLGAALTVTATITDAAGIDARTVCLRLTGETGTCAHPGTAGASNTYTFSLPRPSTPMDGTTPVDFTITAADSLYASLSGTAQAGHITTTAAQHVYFDNVAPSIVVTSDTTPYARDGGNLTVNATISDTTGVASAHLLSGGNSVDAGFIDGGFFQFPLDPTAAPAGAEGTYAFMVVANDGVGNPGDAGAARFIDDAAPDASVRVFSGTDPGTPGVTYPTAVPNTGYTGSSFVYSDTVHVKGTLTDQGGVGAARLHVDGIELDGGVATGVSQTLGPGCAGTCCTLGAVSCSFDVQIALNAPQNGAFNTGVGMSDAGVPAGEAIPSGFLQLSIAAQDQARAGDGTTPHPNKGSSATAARTTRLLWQQALASGNVTGLAVHPSGDVIATSDGTGDSVYDLAPDQPSVRWSFGTATGLGAIPDQPAIGAGDGGTAAIYVASAAGFIDALRADGGAIFQADAGLATTFSVGPAVDDSAWTDGGTAEQAVVPDSSGPLLWAVSTANSAAPFSVASDDVDSFSSPMIFNGFVWFGDGVQGSTGNVTRHPVRANGTFGPAAVATAVTASRPFWGLVTDGTNVFAATVRPLPTQTCCLNMYSLSQALAINWGTSGAASTARLSSEPTLGIDGNVLASDYTTNHTVSKVARATGAFTTLLSLGSGGTVGSPPTGHVALQGSDGHVYLPVTFSSAASILALEGNLLSWQLLLPSASLVRAAAMDCSGRLFVGDGNTVYALVSDDHGLADTTWPNLRRDARNTGNASAPKYGIRTTGPVPCLQ